MSNNVLKRLVLITWLNVILVGILLINSYLSGGDITLFVIIFSIIVICSIVVTVSYFKKNAKIYKAVVSSTKDFC